jgi:hypothetical protein
MGGALVGIFRITFKRTSIQEGGVAAARESLSVEAPLAPNSLLVCCSWLAKTFLYLRRRQLALSSFSNIETLFRSNVKKIYMQRLCRTRKSPVWTTSGLWLQLNIDVYTPTL